jgi:hypothetical protein
LDEHPAGAAAALRAREFFPAALQAFDDLTAGEALELLDRAPDPARAAGTLTGATRYAAARGATLRAHLVNLPARLARPQRRPVLHLPSHWPRARPWLRLWTAVFTT